ncbi:hypothetical protein WJX77_008733 [Trebouxia sp. C0004]
MAADHLNNDRDSARIGSSLIPTAQEANAQATRIYEALDAKGYGIVKRQHAADALADSKYIAPGTDVQPIIKALHLDTEGTVSKRLFIKEYVQYYRDFAKGPNNVNNRKLGNNGAALGATMKQVHDNAKEERRKKYCCVRGSSALNSLSGTDAFRMSIVRVNSAKRLRHLFEQIDTDHDGKFDASDFRFFLHKSSLRLEKMTQGLFNNIDRAGKGFLVFKDFVRMMYPNATESNVRQLMSMARDQKATYKVMMTPERIREMKATFKDCDTDGSGDVSRSEFIEGIQNAGYTAEQAEVMFASVDKDGNGAIVEDDFIRWCQEELQRTADAAVEENDHFMSGSDSDSDDGQLNDKYAALDVAGEAAFAKKLGIDARQLSLGVM